MVIGDASGSIVISSDSFEIDNKRHIVTFTGNVEAVRDDINIKCQKIELFYENLADNNDPGKGRVKILEIIATEKVMLSRPDGGMATAEKAVYNQKDEKVVLTGNPAVVKQDTGLLEGSKIIWFIKEDIYRVEGKAKAIMIPKGEER
jgi:lipopolysaccharide export system protein LptA